MTEHTLLYVGDCSDGSPAYESVHLAPTNKGTYKVLFTPGLAYDIAAEDEIELFDGGRYRVITRGGNLAVRVFSETQFDDSSEQLINAVVTELSGRLDGRIDRGLAFTIPVRAGFPAVQKVFGEYLQTNPAAVWEYGNVYDENGTPIEWWGTTS